MANEIKRFLAKVTGKRQLNKGGDKLYTFIEFDISGSGIQYECGDRLVVRPKNDPQQVERLARIVHFDLDNPCPMSVYRKYAYDEYDSNGQICPHPQTYRTALSKYYDINTPPNVDLLKKITEYPSKLEDREFLRNLTSPAGHDLYQSWIMKPQRGICDVLEDLPSTTITIDLLIDILPPLKDRYYSISTSPKVYPNAIHITVAVIQYINQETGREMKGVATKYLNELNISDFVPIYIIESDFKPPLKNEEAMIMVGTGSGISPFRGFVQERTLAKDKGEIIGETILYFGFRRRNEDFLFEEELQKAVDDGVISSMYLAFSRDQKEKIYVQDLMKHEKNKKQIWNVLEKGGHFYICGDANHMAKEVKLTLLEIIASEGNMDNDKAKAYLKEMESNNLFSEDVWTTY